MRNFEKAKKDAEKILKEQYSLTGAELGTLHEMSEWDKITTAFYLGVVAGAKSQEIRNQEQNTVDPVKVAENLRKLRGEKSLGEVAEAVGVPEQTVLLYEQGERIPRDEIKVRFAKYYNKPVDSIFYLEGVTK